MKILINSLKQILLNTVKQSKSAQNRFFKAPTKMTNVLSDVKETLMEFILDNLVKLKVGIFKICLHMIIRSLDM